MKLLPLSSTLLLLMLTCFTLHAQEAIDTAVFNRIRKAELGGSHIPRLAHLLTDVSGPRLTRSPGYERASKWAIAEMKKWGLQNAVLEPAAISASSGDADFDLMIRVPYAQDLMAYANPWSPDTKGTLQGDVFVMSQRQAMDTTFISANAAKMKGKFILVTDGPANPIESFKATAERYSDSTLANIGDMHRSL